MNEQERPKYYLNDVQRLVSVEARGWANKTGDNEVKAEHLVLALVNDKNVRGRVIRVALMHMRIDTVKLTKALKTRIYDDKVDVPPEIFTDTLPDIPLSEEVIEIVKDSKNDTTDSYVCSQHLLLNILLKETSEPKLGLVDYGLTYQGFREAVLSVFPNDEEFRTI